MAAARLRAAACADQPAGVARACGWLAGVDPGVDTCVRARVPRARRKSGATAGGRRTPHLSAKPSSTKPFAILLGRHERTLGLCRFGGIAGIAIEEGRRRISRFLAREAHHLTVIGRERASGVG